MVCDLTVVRRLERGNRIKHRVGHTNTVELCMKERRVRTTSVPKSRPDDPGDGMCAWERSKRWVASAH